MSFSVSLTTKVGSQQIERKRGSCGVKTPRAPLIEEGAELLNTSLFFKNKSAKKDLATAKSCDFECHVKTYPNPIETASSDAWRGAKL